MDVFKDCPHCGTRWPCRNQFLADPGLELVGYQVDFLDLRLGLLLFNHHPCGTTLAIRAESLEDLYDGPVYTKRQTGSEACQGHCLRRDDLDRCFVLCECAWVREILQIIRDWPKTGTAVGRLGSAVR